MRKLLLIPINWKYANQITPAVNKTCTARIANRFQARTINLISTNFNNLKFLSNCNSELQNVPKLKTEHEEVRFTVVRKQQ